MKKRPKLIINWKYGNYTPEEMAEKLRPYLWNDPVDKILNDKITQAEQRSISDENDEEMNGKLSKD